LTLFIPAAVAVDLVVKMAPFIVEASSGTPWRYFSVSGFEVLSRCPESFNETYARALQQNVAARAALFPPGFLPNLPTPIKIVLYCRPPEKEAAFAPANPIDLQLAPLADALLDGVSIEQASPIVVDDGDTFIVCGNYSSMVRDVRDLSVDPDTDILLQLRTPTFPAWFRSGVTGTHGIFLHRIIQATASGHEIAQFPKASWISHDETIALQKTPLRPSSLLPLGELFDGSGRDSRRELWDSEAALLVRWGLFGKEPDGSGHRESFLRFVDRATKEPTTEQMFRECFGLGYADAQQRLGLYLLQAVSETITVPITTSSNISATIRDARPDEIGRIVGDWARFEGRSSSTGMARFAERDYHRECLDHAAKLFERTYSNGARSPLFLAAYGLYEAQIGDQIAARKALEAATAAGVIRPKAYVELARLRLEMALPYAGQGIGDLREMDYSAIRELLNVARMQMPSLLSSYQLMVRLLAHAPGTPTREEMSMLDEAVLLFPRNAAFACKVATLYKQCGYPDEARAIIEHAMQFAESADARAQLSGFNP
jgi:tetratricopeptide (TPR) repeat protein